MANFLFGYDFVSYSAVASSEDSNYPATNLSVYGFTKRHFRSLVSTEVTIVFDFTTAKALTGVLLNDVNFTDVYIEGHATDSWGAPSFSEQFTPAQDERTQRYKLYAALTAFNYRYMRLRIPSQAPVGSLSVFKIGTLVCLDTALTLTTNPAFGYKYSANEQVAINEFESGGDERVNLGDLLWKGGFAFDAYDRTDESDLWTLNNIKKDENLVFFENRGDVSKVYLCRRDTAIEVSWFANESVRTSRLEYKEIY